jgi:hypothetical protein
MITGRKTPKYWTKPFQFHFCITNPILSALELDPNLSSEKLVCNDLNYGSIICHNMLPNKLTELVSD